MEAKIFTGVLLRLTLAAATKLTVRFVIYIAGFSLACDDLERPLAMQRTTHVPTSKMHNSKRSDLTGTWSPLQKFQTHDCHTPGSESAMRRWTSRMILSNIAVVQWPLTPCAYSESGYQNFFEKC
jgi:hypothetical protein